MSNTDSELLPTVNEVFKKGGLKTFIVNKIKENNTEIPEIFDWDDFDISVTVHFGNETYFSDTNRKTEFIIRIKEDESVKQKYANMRIKLPSEDIVFTSDVILLNDVLNNYGFNTSFSIEKKDDVKALVERITGNVFISSEYEVSALNEPRLYYTNKSVVIFNKSYRFTLVDNDTDSARSDDHDKAYCYSSLLSVKDVSSNDLGEPNGYFISFTNNGNDSDSSGDLSGIDQDI